MDNHNSMILLLLFTLSDADVKLYGSSRSGFGLKAMSSSSPPQQSDVNVDLMAKHAPAALARFLAALEQDTSGIARF